MIGFLKTVAWPFVRTTLVPGIVTHWKVVAIVAASGLAIGEGLKIRSGLIEKGRLEAVTAQKVKENGDLRKAFVAESLRADSAIAAYRVDTLHLTRLIARTDTLRDSVLVHRTDTLWLDRYIAATDSTIKACTETVRSCESVQRDLRAQITTLRQQVNLAAPRVDTVHTRRCGWGGAIGGGAVYDIKENRGHVGPSMTLAGACHF